MRLAALIVTAAVALVVWALCVAAGIDADDYDDYDDYFPERGDAL